jgi:ABC-2 type transport system ATP-binding protein
MNRGDAEARAKDLLKAFDLDAAADRRTGTYSGGMRRRLDVALGMVHRPVVLFLDEPTTGLDPQARARMWDEVRRLRETGTTVFLTTHYLEEADALADQLAIIDHGQIVAEGTADELKRQVAGDVVTLGVDGGRDRVLELVERQPYVREATADDEVVRLYVDQGDAAVPNLLRLLDSAGLSPQTITLARPSLDDVFLRQTGRSLRGEDAAA